MKRLTVNFTPHPAKSCPLGLNIFLSNLHYDTLIVYKICLGTNTLYVYFIITNKCLCIRVKNKQKINLLLRDFKLPPREVLISYIDVSGKPLGPIFKGQDSKTKAGNPTTRFT